MASHVRSAETGVEPGHEAGGASLIMQPLTQFLAGSTEPVGHHVAAGGIERSVPP